MSPRECPKWRPHFTVVAAVIDPRAYVSAMLPISPRNLVPASQHPPVYDAVSGRSEPISGGNPLPVNNLLQAAVAFSIVDSVDLDQINAVDGRSRSCDRIRCRDASGDGGDSGSRAEQFEDGLAHVPSVHAASRGPI